MSMALAADVALGADKTGDEFGPGFSPPVDDRRPTVIEASSVGARLAAARLAKALTHAQASDATRIKPSTLAAIERGDRAALPATAYTVGFVKAYAQFLGLDPQALSADYRKEVAPVEAPSSDDRVRMVGKSVNSARDLSAQARAIRPEKLISIIGLIVSVLCVLWITARVLALKDTGDVSLREAPSVIAHTTPTAAREPLSQSPRPEPNASVTPDLVGAASQASRVKEAPRSVEPPAPAQVERPQSFELRLDPLVETRQLRDPAVPLPPAPPVEAAASPIRSEPEPAPAPAAFKPASQHTDEIIPAALKKEIAPIFPDRCARGAGPLERVTITFDVSVEGRAINAKIAQSSNRCFDAAAKSALGRMRFSPRLENARPAVEVGKSAVFQFAQ